MTKTELKEFLDAKVIQYNNPKFIESDPIQIPHQFILKEDIEIAAFLTATIAWGNRKMIIKNAKSMMELLGNSPYDFVINHKEHHLENLEDFVHRTFNNIDLAYFVTALQHIYNKHKGLEATFSKYAETDSLQNRVVPAIDRHAAHRHYNRRALIYRLHPLSRPVCDKIRRPRSSYNIPL